MVQAPLGALRVFEAVARHGSFSRAAEELCVTQSAVSHQVRGLEDWLGAALFERRGNRANLLPHGAELAAALGRSFGEINAACRRARRAGGPPTLTIAAIPSVAICWLIPRLARFRALAPGVGTRLVYAFHGQPVDFRDVDIAIVYANAPPRTPGMVAARFLPGRAAPVAAPRVADAAGGIDAMLAAGLLHDTDMGGWRGWLDAAGEGARAVPEGPVFEDFNLLRAAALAGQGVALCPLAIVADDLAAGRLALVSGRVIQEESAYYLLTPAAPEPERAKAVALFSDWLAGTAAEAGFTA